MFRSYLVSSPPLSNALYVFSQFIHTTHAFLFILLCLYLCFCEFRFYYPCRDFVYIVALIHLLFLDFNFTLQNALNLCSRSFKRVSLSLNNNHLCFLDICWLLLQLKVSFFPVAPYCGFSSL